MPEEQLFYIAGWIKTIGLNDQAKSKVHNFINEEPNKSTWAYVCLFNFGLSWTKALYTE